MFEQVGIVVFGLTGVVLSQLPGLKFRKWAPVFGLLGQPFWFYASWKAQQFGALAMSVLYTVAWLVGLYTHWFAKSEPKVGI